MTKLSIDLITNKKIAIAKQIYGKALIQSFSSHSPVNCIMSVIGFDLAVETVLKAAIVSLGYDKDLQKLNFENLITEVTNCLTSKSLGALPSGGNIRTVRRIRNAAQHEARTPTNPELNECRTFSKDFLDKIVYQVWDISFDLVSLINFIQNEEVKSLLLDAERECGLGNLVKSVSQSAIGLFLILNSLKELVVGSDLTGCEGDGYLIQAVNILQETILLSILGINFASYAKYREIAGNVTRLTNGSYSVENMKEEINANEAEFVVNFCCDTIIQVESFGEIPNSRPSEQMKGVMQMINSMRRLRQERVNKQKEQEEAEKNRELFIVRFISYDKQIGNLCKVEFFHGGVGYAILGKNSPRTLAPEQQLLYAKVRGHQYGYIIHIL